MSPGAVAARVRRVAEFADLRPEHRLDAETDYSPNAVGRRLRQVAELNQLCQRLGEGAGRPSSE